MGQSSRMPTYSELPLISGQLSRRDFSRLLALGAAGIALPRGSTEGQLAYTALRGLVPPNAIRINSNENPLGPSDAALSAMQALGAEDGRYPFAPEKALEKHIAELEGLPAGYVELYNGSSDPLHRAVLAFTEPGKAYVYGEPGFEAGLAGSANRRSAGNSRPPHVNHCPRREGDGGRLAHGRPAVHLQPEQPHRDHDAAGGYRLGAGEQARGVHAHGGRSLYPFLGRALGGGTDDLTSRPARAPNLFQALWNGRAPDGHGHRPATDAREAARVRPAHQFHHRAGRGASERR